MNSPSPSGGGVSVIKTFYSQLIFRVLTLSLPNVQVKSSLSAAKAKSKSSSLKESTGASNIHPLIDMSKLLQSQVFKILQENRNPHLFYLFLSSLLGWRRISWLRARCPLLLQRRRPRHPRRCRSSLCLRRRRRWSGRSLRGSCPRCCPSPCWAPLRAPSLRRSGPSSSAKAQTPSPGWRRPHRCNRYEN